MKKFFSLLFVFCFGWLLWSCSTEYHTDIFEIKFKELSFGNVIIEDVAQDRAVLQFSFIDGNGNLGTGKSDENSRIYYTWYKKLPDQTYEQFVFRSGTIEQHNTIPHSNVMNRDEAHNKTLKGTIKAYLVRPLDPEDIDTMRIEFYIVDRLKNKSNVEYTPDFSILNLQDIIIP